MTLPEWCTKEESKATEINGVLLNKIEKTVYDFLKESEKGFENREFIKDSFSPFTMAMQWFRDNNKEIYYKLLD